MATAICPEGHPTEDTEYCDVCGLRMPAAAGARPPAGGGSGPGAGPGAGTGFGAGAGPGRAAAAARRRGSLSPAEIAELSGDAPTTAHVRVPRPGTAQAGAGVPERGTAPAEARPRVGGEAGKAGVVEAGPVPPASATGPTAGGDPVPPVSPSGSTVGGGPVRPGPATGPTAGGRPTATAAPPPVPVGRTGPAPVDPLVPPAPTLLLTPGRRPRHRGPSTVTRLRLLVAVTVAALMLAFGALAAGTQAAQSALDDTGQDAGPRIIETADLPRTLAETDAHMAAVVLLGHDPGRADERAAAMEAYEAGGAETTELLLGVHDLAVDIEGRPDESLTINDPASVSLQGESAAEDPPNQEPEGPDASNRESGEPAEQDTSGQSVPGQDPAVQDPAGQGPTGPGVPGQATPGQGPAGPDALGQDTAGQAATEPTEPAATTEPRDTTATAAHGATAQALDLAEAYGRYRELAGRALALSEATFYPAGAVPEPVAAARAEAAAHLREEVLPLAEAVSTDATTTAVRNTNEARDTVDAARSGVVLGSGAALGALVWLQVFLARRFQRTFSPALLVATAITAMYTYTGVTVLATQTGILEQMTVDGLTPVLAEAAVRTEDTLEDADATDALTGDPAAAASLVPYQDDPAASEQVADAFTTSVAAGEAAIGGLEFLVPVAMLSIAVVVVVGTAPRLAEYR